MRAHHISRGSGRGIFQQRRTRKSKSRRYSHDENICQITTREFTATEFLRIFHAIYIVEVVFFLDHFNIDTSHLIFPHSMLQIFWLSGKKMREHLYTSSSFPASSIRSFYRIFTRKNTRTWIPSILYLFRQLET